MLGTAGVGVASAHTQLVASAPGAGAVLERGPDVVSLRFSQPLAAPLSSARVVAPDGRDLAGVRVGLGTDARVMLVRLPPLDRGTYSTIWTAVGSADPHRARGLLVFRVGPGAAPVPATSSSPPPLLSVLVRWVGFVLLAGTIGALAVVGLVVRPARREAAATAAPAFRHAEARLLTLAMGCALGALTVGVLALPLDALVLLAWEPQLSVELLGGTRWGGLWLVQETLLAAMGIVVALLRRAGKAEPRLPGIPGARSARVPGPGLVLAGLLAVGLAVVRALDGHAAEVGPRTALSVVTLALHTLAAAAWTGGVLALLVGVWPLRRKAIRADALVVLRGASRPFARLVLASAGLLIVTGIYTAGRQVASADALIRTVYGQGLAAKAALLLLAGILGASVARAAARAARVRGERRPTRLRALAAAEATVALSILLAAALMSSASPAARAGARAGHVGAGFAHYERR